MDIVSCFDGISCAQIALNNLGIPYDNYYASEICPKAIRVTQRNFPKTIQVGDVSKVKGSMFAKIDLLVGGSPCQGFSFSGKMLNFEDPRSKLIFEYVRLKKELAPQYFMLENVVMAQKYQDVISDLMECEPIRFNSGLVSAQNRERLYWTNLPKPSILDLGIDLLDILESRDFVNPSAIRGRKVKGDTAHTQFLEVRSKNANKSNCLTTAAKDNVLTNLPAGKYPDAFKNKLPFRHYTVSEMCRLQTVPESYFDGLDFSRNQITKLLGNAWTVKLIEYFFSDLNN